MKRPTARRAGRGSRRPSTEPALAVSLAALLASAACAPSVTVRRLAPAPYNLGQVKHLVLAEVDGATARERDLVRVRLLERMDQQQVFSIDDAAPRSEDIFDFFERLFSKERRSREDDPAEFRRRHPADVYVRLRVTRVHAFPRSKSTKKKDKEGNPYVEVRHWAEGECSFQLTLVDGREGQRLARFTVSRQANSPTYDEWRESLLATAEREAVNHAVDEALSQFTPRRVSETLVLDEKAPRAKEGIDLIKDDRLQEARLLWEKAAKEGDSAGLAYNLGCVSEALNDTKAAAEWYEDAIRLDPSKERNRKALADLQHRLADAERLRKGD